MDAFIIVALGALAAAYLAVTLVMSWRADARETQSGSRSREDS